MQPQEDKKEDIFNASVLKPCRAVTQMTKKVLGWVVLCSFLVTSWSCVYKFELKPLESIRPGKREGLEIYAVRKKTGESVQFNKVAPAIIKGDALFEEKLVKIAIEKSNIDHPKYFRAETHPFNLTTKDGRVYRVVEGTEQGNKIVGEAYGSLPVMPLSDIDLVAIRRVNLAKTLLNDRWFPFAAWAFFILAVNRAEAPWVH
ncbi:MAG: hypothetical protein A2W03_01405 [Candidatus Aminicenantes bacterium RBG_16_63_16]|nr:MAG: hypothetical protein A2W03_01405 [Candidatus Aminicenantes bacterium RBG_16_63_16]